MKKCVQGSPELKEYLKENPNNRVGFIGNNPKIFYYQLDNGSWSTSFYKDNMEVVSFADYFNLPIDRNLAIDYTNSTDEEMIQIIAILNNFGESVFRDLVDEVNAKRRSRYNYKSLICSSTSKQWARSYNTPTITAKEFINKYSSTIPQSIMNTPTVTTEKSKAFNQTAFFTEDREFKILWSDVRTEKATIAKEVFLTRTLKVGGVERDVSLAVIIDESWSLHAGYSVRNPKFDKVNNTEIAKRVARNRAIHPRTNLLRNEGITPELVSKQVLRGIADMIFAKIINGEIEIKGIK